MYTHIDNITLHAFVNGLHGNSMQFTGKSALSSEENAEFLLQFRNYVFNRYIVMVSILQFVEAYCNNVFILIVYEVFKLKIFYSLF